MDRQTIGWSWVDGQINGWMNEWILHVQVDRRMNYPDLI